MAFFRSVRNKLHLDKYSDDSSLVNSPRPEKDNINSRRNVTKSRSETHLSRGHGNAQDSISSNPSHSDSSTLEKKLEKPKMLGKFNTLSAPMKPPTLNANEGCAHHPSHHATNIHYKWKTEVPTKLLRPSAMSDLQSDPLNFLFEELPTLKELRKESANTERRTSIDSSTFRRTKDRMQSDSKKSDERTYRNPQHCQCNRTELMSVKQREQSSEKEPKNYCCNIFKDIRETYGEKLFDLIKEAPDNLAWFVDVEEPGVQLKEGPPENRIVSVAVAKPILPSLDRNHNSTKHHTRRLTKLQSPLEASASSTKSDCPCRNGPKTGGGRLKFGSAASLPGRMITNPIHNQDQNSTKNTRETATQCDSRSNAYKI